MKIKSLPCLVIIALSTFIPALMRAQPIRTLSNTNDLVVGTTLETYGTRIPFTVGYNQGGYQLTGFSIMLGDNSAADFPNIVIRLFSANSPINLDNDISDVTVPTPRSPGLFTVLWPTNVFLPGQMTDYAPTYYNFFVAPAYNLNSVDALSVSYTTSTNYADNAGWDFYPANSSINGDPTKTALFNIYATVLPPPKTFPIVLTNVMALPDGTFKFGFTNSPNLNFSVYATTNVSLPFTNWLFSANPDYLGTNYYQYSTGPGITTSTNFPRIYFRVTSP